MPFNSKPKRLKLRFESNRYFKESCKTNNGLAEHSSLQIACKVSIWNKLVKWLNKLISHTFDRSEEQKWLIK